MSGLCLSLGLLIAASTVALVVLTHSPVPFGDQWFNIVSGKAHDASWFFAFHNEHRLVLPRLAFLLDDRFDAERNGVDLTLNLLLLAGTVAVLIDMVHRAELTTGDGRLLAWVGLALGLFSSIQVENLICGFQVQFFGVCLLAASTFSVLAFAPVGLPAVALAALLSVAASYTLSAGLLVGIVAVGLGTWLGRPRVHVLALATVEGVTLACYFVGYRTPQQNSSPLEALGHLGSVLVYFVTEIGGPVSTLLFASGGLAVVLAVAAGAVGLGLFAVRALRFPREAPRTPAMGVFAATACFCVAFAGLTSLGRWSFGPGQALAGRYQTPMLLFWFCTMALWTPRTAETSPARKAAFVAAAVGILALVAANQPRYFEFAMRVEALEAAATPALLADVADPKALSILSDHPAETVLTEAEALRQAHASVFHDAWAGLLGRPFADARALASLPACRGSFDAVGPVGTPPRSGWSAVGRLEGTGRFRGRARLLLAGPDGRVVGYGVGGLSAVAVGAPGPRTAIDGDFWRGAFKATSPDGIVGYVLDGTGRAACALDAPKPGGSIIGTLGPKPIRSP